MTNDGELRLRENMRHDGRYSSGGRWSKAERDYESGLIGGDLARAALLPDLLRSPDPMDRVRAMVYIDSFRVTVPAFVVVETPDSPNLYTLDREPTLERRLRIIAQRTVWSAHVDEADAKAWCEVWREKFDADLAKHPWWGEGARRIFGVEFRDDAPVNQLRQPGADPRQHIY